MVDESRDVLWYVENRGLATGGIDITTLTNDHISVAEIEAVFGPKFSKSGYRYDRKPEQNVVASIEELYGRVTGKSKVLNFTLNQCFARGVVAWLKGEVLDWAKYAVHCQTNATGLKTTKLLNREWKEQGLIGKEESQHGQKPTVAAKHRRTQSIGTGRPSHVKMESGVTGMLPMPLKIHQIGGPDWKVEEISAINDFVKTLNTMLIDAKQNVADAEEQHKIDVAAFQVSKMQLEGREKVYLDSESHKLDLVKDLTNLVSKYRLQGDLQGGVEYGQSLESLVQSFLKTDSSSLVSLPSDINEVQQKLEWVTKSDQIALSMLNISRQDCETTSKKEVFSLATIDVKREKVQYLNAQILLVDQQFEQMRKGDGSGFYPQPLVCDPIYDNVFSNTQVIQINDCPICGLGFQFNDILVASCGHTYHMICMNWHCKQSLCCKVPSCGIRFHQKWLLSVGVRRLLMKAEGLVCL